MKPTEAWKNFNLGSELSVSGTFIYNGIRRFHEVRRLDNADEVFEILYNLSVGLERLLKIVVVLVEHTDQSDTAALEKSLITHNHVNLLDRVRKAHPLNLGKPQIELLGLLAKFYKSIRYDRFCLSSAYDPNKELATIQAFIGKHLKVEVVGDSIFGVSNEERYRKFMRKIVNSICSALYKLVEERARALNLYTYELRYGSKAFTVFLGKADIPAEDVLWKELLVFFMNSDADNGAFRFLREIEPLPFDPALATDYLSCFQSDAAKSEVVDELKHHYEETENPGERLKLMSIIGNPNVYFDSDDDEDDEELEDDPEPAHGR
jgi:hypothetical protein